MNRFSRLVVLLLLALWLPATQHCDLEAAGLAPASVTCQDEHATRSHSADSCAVVEHGDYKSATTLLKPPAPALLACSLCGLAALLPPPVFVPLISPERTDSPPELVRVWHFDHRAALPSRAPTLLG